MTDRIPDEAAQVDATGDRQRAAAADATTGPAANGEHLTAGTMFAPGLVQEATTEDARGPAEG